MDKPVDPERMRHLEAMAREIAAALGRATARILGTGFTLFLYNFDGSECTYISNSQRADMVKILQEFINKNIPAMTWDEQHG